MSRLLWTLLLVSVISLFFAADVRAAGPPESNLSPVVPPVVREGDFALRLVEVLGLGRVSDEVEAESLLASKGVTPRNGWIADYPVTPVVMGELREAVMAASQSGALPLSGTNAATAFDALAMELGMAPGQAEGEVYASGPPEALEPPPPSTAYGEYPAAYDTYYADGPPIYTYYAPPYAYYGLYDWVPYPFLYTGIFFSGFFILHDFHRHHHYHNRYYARGFGGDRLRNRFVSNHRFDRAEGRAVRVRPAQAFRQASRTAALDARRDLNRGSGSRSFEGPRGFARQGPDDARRELLTSRGSGGGDGSGSVRGTNRFEANGLNRSSSGNRSEGRNLDFRSENRAANRFSGGGTSDSSQSFRSFNRGGGDSFRPSRSFRSGDGGGVRAPQSFRGGAGDSFRSSRSFGGSGGGSARSFGSWDGGFSSGGGFSGRGGGGGGRR